MRIKYNAPFTLTFALAAAVVLLLTQYVAPQLITGFFTVGSSKGTNWGDPLSYLRLISHVLGHADWNHYLSNFSFILLLGPILEEKYSTQFVLLMVIVTALATGLINSLFFSTSLIGASGIVFMMIILVSFTNIKAGEIPLTFVVILLIYVGKEVLNSFQHDDISQFAHILGGVTGSVFGFIGTHLGGSGPQTPAKK